MVTKENELVSLPSIISELAVKLSDLKFVSQVFDKGSYWNSTSLSEGYTGHLLFFAAMQEEESKYEQIVHQCVLAIKGELETKGLSNLSMFTGATGIAFSLQQASDNGKKYQKMIETLHDFIFKGIESTYMKPLSHNINMKRSSDPTLYDVVSGLSGVGGYFLENLSDPQFEKGSYQIANLLVDFCNTKIPIGGCNVPGWHLTPDTIYGHALFKSGNGSFNLGLAHGITGVLSFLSIAYLKGVQVEGQKEAIQKVSSWIREWSINYEKTIQWPYHISWEEETGLHPPLGESSREGWCYGVPGIARVLFLAGKALSDHDLKEFSIKAFLQLFNRSSKEWGLQNSALCHGLSGILLTSKLMSKEEGGQELNQKIQDMEKELLSSYNPNLLFGFDDQEQDRIFEYDKLAHPGFLEGVTGILLPLLPITETTNKWYLPLMIHG